MISLQQLCHRYSGVWEGSSLSNSGDPTKWVDTMLIFRPRIDRRFGSSESKDERNGDEDAHGKKHIVNEGSEAYDAATTTLVVEGRGVSKWQNMDIFFLLSGDVDLVTGRPLVRLWPPARVGPI